MIGRFLGTIGLALVLWQPALAGDGDPVISYEQRDIDMNAAQDAARGELDRFFGHVLDAGGMAQQGAGVKVAFPFGEDNFEVIWVSPFGVRDGQLLGVLANQPHNLEGRSAGDTVTFDRAQVRDWYFFGADGKMYGSYTTRVMLADLDEDSARQIARMLSESPTPPDW